VDGEFAIPRKPDTHITLNGRDAKIITASYDFGSQHLLYSTSEIFTHIKQDSRDVILVYAYEGEHGEFAIASTSGDIRTYGVEANVSSSFDHNVLQVNYIHPDGSTYVSAVSSKDGSEILLVVSGYRCALRWWAPQSSGGDKVLVSGPYLVRSAEIEGSRLSLTGDTDANTDIEIIVSDVISEVTWNGIHVMVTPTQHGTLTGQLPGPEEDVEIPDLEKAKWKYSPASPETANNFNDSNWVAADHQATSNPWQPMTLPVLYADDYGMQYIIEISCFKTVHTYTCLIVCRLSHWKHLVSR
jgi:Beta-galactosidase, domain 2/Beta-galactosidase, domain 3